MFFDNWFGLLRVLSVEEREPALDPPRLAGREPTLEDLRALADLGARLEPRA